MIISHKYKFIFFCNGKTGTTSIENCLLKHNEVDFNFNVPGFFNTKHIPPSIAKAFVPSSIWNSYFKFVFVRNPWDWFVSNWKYNFRYRRFPNYYISRPKEIFRLPKAIKENELNRKEIFSTEDVDLLFNYLKKFRTLPYSECYFQSNYVFDIEGNQLVDFVGRYEMLDENFDKITKRIGIAEKLPHLNKTKTKIYTNYFTSESRERVRELWKKDIDAFGYNFG